MRRLFLLLALFAGPALAHDLWIENEGNAWTLLQGHRHSAHAGADLVPYEIAALKGILCLDGRGGSKSLNIGKSTPAKVGGDCAGLLATLSTGYWTKTAWETRNAPKTGIAGVIKSWYSEESLKYIERWTASSATPLGQGLEITPTVNPLTLKAGDKLVVLITDAGQPVAGVPVAYAGDTRGASGSDGKVAIRLRHGGLQLIEASLEAPLADGKADSSIRTTSLQFEIAP